MKPALRKLYPGMGHGPGWPNRVFFLVSLLLGLIGFASLVLAAPVGTFIQVEGTVEVLRQGKPPAVPAKIRAGDQLIDQPAALVRIGAVEKGLGSFQRGDVSR